MNRAERITGFRPPANAAELFGFEFTEEYLETRLRAQEIGGQEGVKQFDRFWKALAMPIPELRKLHYHCRPICAVVYPSSPFLYCFFPSPP